MALLNKKSSMTIIEQWCWYYATITFEKVSSKLLNYGYLSKSISLSFCLKTQWKNDALTDSQKALLIFIILYLIEYYFFFKAFFVI